MKIPRLKWIYVVVFILGFGLPFHLLPDKLKGEDLISNIYNTYIGSEWFTTTISPPLEKVIGGSLRLFTEHVFENSYYTEPDRTSLRVTGVMPEGCTIEQLNAAIIKMETYLSQFEEVEFFETRISNYRNSNISIYFKEQNEFSGFPYTLKSLIEAKTVNLGGLDWTISGIGRGFSNALRTGRKSNNIILEGYNYNTLYGFAEALKSDLIKSSNRIKDVEITSGNKRDKALYEYYLEFDNYNLSRANISQQQVYKYLKNKLHSGKLSSIIQNNELQDVKLVSDTYKI